MQERLLAVYFIDGLYVGGGTHWVLDKGGEVYAYMTINRRAFDLSNSDFLTLKERTVFSREPSKYSIEIDVGGHKKCLLYILTHESVHLVDFVAGITPYAEEVLHKIKGGELRTTSFTEGVWWQFDQPERKYRFKQLSQLEFYRKDARGGIPMSDSKRIYEALEKTPFASLYSMTNWSEDLAEAITMWHLSEKLGLSYSIRVKKDGEKIFHSQPVKKALFQKRPLPLEDFYK